MHHVRRTTGLAGVTVFVALLLACGVLPAKGQSASTAQATAPPAAAAPGTLFSADQLNALLPATVYFQGRTAPLQLRNAGAAMFKGDQIVWVSLVDSSGYASSVQEKYQFYLVTEGPLTFGGVALPAGAYGGGFVGGSFLVMDLGGHTVAQGPVQTDSTLPRPRPLQLQMQGDASARLLLGRRFVDLRAGR